MNILNLLSSPVPVAWFQNLCGIKWKHQDPNNPLYPVEKPKSSNNIERNFVITNRAFFFLAKGGSELAGEPFYYVFFPACAWIFERTIARRTLMMLTASMFVGQSLKDILKQPRPTSPPVIRLDEMYETEYGMPSTHTMCGVTSSFSLLLITSQVYQVPLGRGVIIASVWSSLVMISRVYLGMHSLLETFLGALLSALLLLFIPAISWLEEAQMEGSWLISATLGIGSFLLSWVMFQLDSDTDESTGLRRWNTARGDTSEILGWCAGFLIGSRCATFYDILHHLPLTAQHQNLIPLTEAGPSAFHYLVRFAAGALMVGPSTLLLRKSLFYLFKFVNGFAKLGAEDAKRKPAVELPYKFFSTFISGFASTCLVPAVLQYFKIW